MEEQMKSVDRDYGASLSLGKSSLGMSLTSYLSWVITYSSMTIGAFSVFAKIRDEAHLRGLPFFTHVQIVLVSLIFFSLPLIGSLGFRSYIKKALKENLVSERVAK